MVYVRLYLNTCISNFCFSSHSHGGGFGHLFLITVYNDIVLYYNE